MLTPTRRWFDARVVRAWWESETLRGMALDCPGIAARHAAPGQYVRVQLDDGENPYALASAPGAAQLELLYKADTPLTTAMSGLVAGDVLPMTAPEGAGFPVAEHAGRDLILVAAGTGIAPLRAVVQVVLRARGRYGEVTLFYGQREASHYAYVAEWEAWRAAGVELHAVLSGEGGRVQDALAARRPGVGNAVAYLAGMKDMVAHTKAVLRGMGMDEERVYLNF